METEYTPPVAPNELGESGQKVWRDVVSQFELTSGELAILAEAAAEKDLIDALNAEWVRLGTPYVSVGSMRQEVIHPLIGELRQHRAVYRQLIASLKLPPAVDEPEQGVNENARLTASEAGRKGAQIRWGSRLGVVS